MGLSRIAVLAASIAVLASGSALAAPREVAPLTPADCQKVADVLSKRLKGMAISITTTESPTTIADSLTVSGTGCTLTGSQTGLPRNFFFDTLEEPYFKGWEQVLPVAADGPNGTVFGWSKGPTVVIYDLRYGVPESLCKSAKDYDACEDKYRKQWVYRLKATAFRFTDGGAITEKDFKQ